MGNNHTSVKRLALVLFVCLSVQIGALSAPFVHLHADEGHNTGHHGGRAVHRHVQAHETATHHHADEFHAGHSAKTQHSTSVDADGEPTPTSLDGLTTPPATSITTLAGPAPAFNAWSHGPLTPPLARVGSPVPAPPDISPPPLRGPPR